MMFRKSNQKSKPYSKPDHRPMSPMFLAPGNPMNAAITELYYCTDLMRAHKNDPTRR